MSIINIFRYHKRPVASKPIINVLYQIKSGKFQWAIKNLRSAYHRGADTEFNAIKNSILQFSVSGNFRMKNDRLHLSSYSGLMLLQIPYFNPRDHASVRKALIEDPFVMAVFTNAMGNGLEIIVKTKADLATHPKFFRHLLTYYQRVTGVRTFSKAGKDIDVGCMVSSDPEIHMDLFAKAFPEALLVEEKV